MVYLFQGIGNETENWYGMTKFRLGRILWNRYQDMRCKSASHPVQFQMTPECSAILCNKHLKGMHQPAHVSVHLPTVQKIICPFVCPSAV